MSEILKDEGGHKGDRQDFSYGRTQTCAGMVVKMPACKIIGLAETIIAEFGNAETEIKKIGIRPG